MEIILLHPELMCVAKLLAFGNEETEEKTEMISNPALPEEAPDITEVEGQRKPD